MRRWHAAVRQWNGQESIQSVAPYDDEIGLVDGGTFITGTPWTGTLDEFRAHVLSNVAHGHGCAAPRTTAAATIDGEPAVGVAQTCASSAFLVRVIVVHERFGLVACEQVVPGKESVALGDLIEWLGGLTWKAA